MSVQTAELSERGALLCVLNILCPFSWTPGLSDKQSVKMSDTHGRAPKTLKETCLRAVRTHFDAVGVLRLPTSLISELLPHLTICQLDEIQPALNQRGISSFPGWMGVLIDMCGPKQLIDLQTEEEAKQEVMLRLFPVVFYGFTNPYVIRNMANLNTPSFLWAAAKCVTRFLLKPNFHQKLFALTAEQRPLLSLFERHVKTVISFDMDLSKRTNQIAQYVFHRLVDHGVANRLVVHSDCPLVLAWLLCGRGTQYVHPDLVNLMHKKASCISQDTSVREGKAGCSSGLVQASKGQDDEHIPRKRPKICEVSPEEEEESKTTNLENVVLDPQKLCQAFAPCDAPTAGTCPRGQIDYLELSNCLSGTLNVLNSALPTFYCLRSLILHSSLTFSDLDVFTLARALRQLSESSHSSLTHLSVSTLPRVKLVEVLLDASSKLKSLDVELCSIFPIFMQTDSASPDMTAELSLEKLTIKLQEHISDLAVYTSVLRCSPNLNTFHVAGMRLPPGSSQRQLLTALSELNPALKSLHLEDMKLSDCLPEILHLLKICKLEELTLNDCRLLEELSDKEEGLRQLVTALKKVPSLHTLSLAQNRLAKHVCVLVELFSGSSPSSVTRLNLSSNFIQPAELLEFAERLHEHRPRHRLSLDLRKNPANRDPNMWDSALMRLRPFCIPLADRWMSTNPMADHISNM